MAVQRLRDFLNSEGARYVVLQHSPAFSAQEVAASAHVPGQILAKVVAVSLDDEPVLVALPATRRVPLDRLAEVTGASRAALIEESDMLALLPECDAGAIPPFGHLFGLRTLVADALARAPEIAFSDGSCTEVMVLAWDDYQALARPELLDLG